MDCLFCDDAPAIDDLGFCVHCIWIYRAETEAGWLRLCRYLQGWAGFREWELAHAIAPPSRAA
jgi:hypothetical protein